MTLPRLESDWLILAPSFSLSPVAPVASARSLPARSTMLMVDRFSISFPAAFFDFCVNLMPTMVWARELVAFMFVLAMVLFTLPSSILSDISA